MENEIMVSICCLAYNHEKYIRKTLEGFVNQKTNFNYEILIHDDCSTDNTVNIVEEYRKKYPKLIKPIYQKENQHSKGIKISNVYQFPRAQGKYIAMCEGDDYYLKGKSFFHEMKGVGDVPLIFYIMTRGNMYYIDEEMSLYRKNSIGSWSNNFSSNSACRLQYYHDEINFLEKYDLYTNSRFHH